MKNLLLNVNRGLIIVLILSTLIPLLSFEYWFIRIFDFPRIQIFFLTVFSFIIFISFDYKHRKRGKFLLLALAGIIIYQLINMWPYTPFASKDAKPASPDISSETQIRVLVANVFMKNDKYNQFIHLLEEINPDLYLTLESDKKWEKHLDMTLSEYPFVVKVPLDNTYGMHLYSKFPLIDSRVKYWLDKDIPSIHTFIKIPSGDTIEFYGVHPKPPVPQEDEDSRKRDAEIIIVANRVSKTKNPVIVAGDFNDVAWSSTTILFRKVSSLLDPRIGRGFYNTYHAQNPLLRWPLDHIFYSSHFKLVELKKLPDINSDHFPMFIHLNYEPEDKHNQDTLKPDPDTKKKETQTIEEGIKDAEHSE